MHVATQGLSFRTRQDAQIVRRGCGEGLARATGSRGEVAVETEVRVSVREPKRIRWNGAALASAEELRSRIHALAFTPDRLARRQGRAGDAPRLLRPRALARAARQVRTSRPHTRPRSGNATPHCAASLRASPMPLRSTPGRTRSSPSRRSSSRHAPGCSRCSSRPLPSGPASSGSNRRRSATTLSPPSRNALDERLASRPRARHHRARPAPRRDPDPRRRPRPAGLRVAGRAAHRRPLAPPRRGRAARRAGRGAAAAPARRRPVGARRRPPPHAQRSPRVARPDARDGNGSGGAAARAGAAPGRDAGHGPDRADGAARRVASPGAPPRGRSRRRACWPP